jgi:phage gpG-like protein
MAGEFKLTMEVAGEQQLSRGFSRLADNISDATEPFEESADDFKKVEEKWFESEGNGAWQPLSPNYATWKDRNYPGTKILERAGLLRESLAGSNPWTIRDIQPLQMKLGTTINYAGRHQTGKGRLPQRKVIDLQEEDKTRWVKIFQKWLVNRENKAFAGLAPTIGAQNAHLGSI